ncbi:hypothetical protein RJ639_027792 [Escallonia herrerae]|uniref:BAG family molecular chaperone regulator 7 n=1 Tax=Escallonia herrerae TaxID=1293975 RepID=A0AA89BQD9_9ASTE|nr:hypothetical protein RJ639_027792 [Escallonia herrerae]
MSRFGGFDIIEQTPSFFLKETSIFAPKTLTLNPFYPSLLVEDELDFTLDLLNPNPTFFDLTSPFDHFDTITDLVQIERTPFHTSTRRIQRRVKPLGAEVYFQSLADRVSALELGFHRLVNPKPCPADRKYSWTAEIKEKDGPERRYKWTAEIEGGKTKKNDKESHIGKTYKWTAEIKGKGGDPPILRTYTFKSSTGRADGCSGSDKKEKKHKKKEEKPTSPPRVVEIQDSDHGAVILRQAFAKRVGAVKSKGKKKELSPQDAALMIQMTFRAYLIKRSQALRGLRELAVAKAKLKELRVLFNNFSYRRRLVRDAEERQRFAERIIVLLLTVDAIEGSDLMVRGAKRSMVDELEAMLDVVDPQPQGHGRSLSMKRRTFDMPDGVIQKELAAGVAQVVQMLEQEPNGSENFEACW